MTRWNSIGWPESISINALRELEECSAQKWFSCSDICQDYHAFYWFFISLHLIDKDNFMTPGYVLDILQDEILARIEQSPQLNVLLAGSASEQSAALVCSKLEEWRPMNWTLTVIDRCKTPLNRISQYLDPKIRLVYGDLAHIDANKGRFNMIIADCVLEPNTFDDKQEMLASVSNLLSENGIVVQRERTGDVVKAFDIGRECDYVVRRARNLLEQNGIPPKREYIDLLRSRTFRFLLQILDTHDAYESGTCLETDITRYLQILYKEYEDNVSEELIYRYYLLGKQYT